MAPSHACLKHCKTKGNPIYHKVLLSIYYIHTETRLSLSFLIFLLVLLGLTRPLWLSIMIHFSESIGFAVYNYNQG